jgi:cyanophycinase
MVKHRKGTLIIIGGHEEKGKHGETPILQAVAQRVGTQGMLLIITAASTVTAEPSREYREVFTALGVKTVEVLDIRTQEDAHLPANVEKVAKATAMFFTGGDQLRITSQLGGSPVYQCMHRRYGEGATIAGTSAGAAAMPTTMLISGTSDASPVGADVGMAPGLGLLDNVVIDTHFAERGRLGRLLGAVAHNPRNLGIGLDEDTALIVERNQCHVLGSGAVSIIDGSEISYTSLTEKESDTIISIYNTKLHILGENDRFDLQARRPLSKNGS